MPCLPTMPAPDSCQPPFWRRRSTLVRCRLVALCGLLVVSLAAPAHAAFERAGEKNGRAADSHASVASVPGVTGASVDWQRGVLEASASAAADLYAASVEVARLKAERLARARAEERLRRALAALRSDARLVARVGPAGVGALDVRSAQVRFIDYGSNGSVVLRLSLPLSATPAAPAKAAGSSAGPSPTDAGTTQDAATNPPESPEN